MFIANNVNFDNTLNVKNFAKTQEAETILNDNFHGSEKQLYKIGDLVDGNGHALTNTLFAVIESRKAYLHA